MAATAATTAMASDHVHSRNSPIDLTQDDDDGPMQRSRYTQDSFCPPSTPPLLRPHGPRSSPYHPLPPLMNPYPQPRQIFSQSLPHLPSLPSLPPHLDHRPHQTPPPQFTYAPNYNHNQYLPPIPPQIFNPRPSSVIDLTDSPSPPPPLMHNLPLGLTPVNPDDPPKTPVCIGQLFCNALVLYPIQYLIPRDPSIETEWVTVRLQYEHNPHRMGNPETIHIRTPTERPPSGDIIPGEAFAVVEQKVATSLGGMLGKGLIRLEAKIRRGKPNLPVVPLQLLVYTPKGNITVVGNYLSQCNLLLDHPTPPYDNDCRLTTYPYYNPHNPPPGGHSRPLMLGNRLDAIGKTQDIQRSQVDEVFKHLKDGVNLPETEPTLDIATKLYPHQKKAITFLLDREREKPAYEGQFSTLWRSHVDPMSQQQLWTNLVTDEEVPEEPKETKGAILADDMGLGKTITCVSLIAATVQSAKNFAAQPLEQPQQPPQKPYLPSASHFAGAVWGMPQGAHQVKDSKAKKAEREQEKQDAEYVRVCRIKVRSRATLIICPLSIVANWEDQFREHWRGEVVVVGGSGNCANASSTATSSSAAVSTNGTSSSLDDSTAKMGTNANLEKPIRVRDGTPLRVYIYHGNARRPDPTFLADFDVVITTYATLASEFSKQNRTAHPASEDGEDAASADCGSSDEKVPGRGGDSELEIVEAQTGGMTLEPKPKKAGTKRKKPMTTVSSTEISSPLQSINWFRIVLDEAHSIKETQTLGCRACCDLIADRRLCLTGTPIQNKLDDVYALIKFLRLKPFDDKNVWTKFISGPAKYGQREGYLRLRTIMACITLRRTKETRTQDGRRILSLPSREDKLVRLDLGKDELEIYNQYFSESKAEFTDLSRKNQVMKNYVGILQKLLRLRQICDHIDLIGVKPSGLDPSTSYENIVAAIAKEGINPARASAVFTILREAATTQCTECGGELCTIAEGAATRTTADGTMDATDGPPPSKRGRKSRGQTSSRAPTRANTPSGGLRFVLTRCQHLFCLECYRNSICPGWPDVPATLMRLCSACQTELSPEDVVEMKPDMILDIASSGDGKKAKKETREERIKRVEKRLGEIEARLTQQQELAGMSSSYPQLPTMCNETLQQTQNPNVFKMEQDVKPTESVFQQEGNTKPAPGPSLSQANNLRLAGLSVEQEYDVKPKQEHVNNFMTPSFEQELDTKPTRPSHPGSQHLIPPSQSHDDEMRWEMDVSSLGLPPPNIREQATALLQEEVCQRSTKIKALISRLMPFSLANPHSANYNPAGLDVQIVDSDGNSSPDNVIKTIVFSQWTSMLDKIEDALLIHKIRYDRLDGTMKREERSRALEALKYDPACEVLLVSLKAGGVGLNLTAAQRVILMDPCWNPAVENQAIDRIHRLGQTKPVSSIKFIIAHSIEESMLKIQERKNKLAEMTLAPRTKQEIMEQRMEELKELFQ